MPGADGALQFDISSDQFRGKQVSFHDRTGDTIDGGARGHGRLRGVPFSALARHGVGHEHALTLIAAAEQPVDQQFGLGQWPEMFHEAPVAIFGACMRIDRFEAERQGKPLALVPQHALHLRARHEGCPRAAPAALLQTIHCGRPVAAADVPASVPRDAVTDVQALRFQRPLSS